MRIAGRPIELRPHRVHLARTPADTIASLRDGLGRQAVISDGDSVVARFTGRAALLPYETVEIVRFSERAVTFEHLLGPFRSCAESFEVVAVDDGSHALEHRGNFVMRGGLLG
jgi:hypothetical protein